MLIAYDEITRDTWQAQRLELLMTSSVLPMVVLNRSASCGGRQTTFSISFMLLFFFSFHFSLSLLLVCFPTFAASRKCVLSHNTLKLVLLSESDRQTSTQKRPISSGSPRQGQQTAIKAVNAQLSLSSMVYIGCSSHIQGYFTAILTH